MHSHSHPHCVLLLLASDFNSILCLHHDHQSCWCGGVTPDGGDRLCTGPCETSCGQPPAQYVKGSLVGVYLGNQVLTEHLHRAKHAAATKPRESTVGYTPKTQTQTQTQSQPNPNPHLNHKPHLNHNCNPTHL